MFAPTKAIIYALKKFGWFYTLPSFFIFSICFQLWGYVNFNIQHDIFIQYFRMFWDVLMELLLELLPQMKINPTTWIAKASFIEYTGKCLKCTIYKLFFMYIIRFCFELNAYIPYTNFFGVGCLRCQLQIYEHLCKMARERAQQSNSAWICMMSETWEQYLAFFWNVYTYMIIK